MDPRNGAEELKDNPTAKLHSKSPPDPFNLRSILLVVFVVSGIFTIKAAIESQASRHQLTTSELIQSKTVNITDTARNLSSSASNYVSGPTTTSRVALTLEPPELPLDVPDYARTYWMRLAIQTLPDLTGSMCPFAAFGAVIVNHTKPTSDGLGELVCVGVNANARMGNPILHGETAAIMTCSRVLTDPNGLYKLSSGEALNAYKDLSMYTTAEPCPMCASVMIYAHFAEIIYATSMRTLQKFQWPQLDLTAEEVIGRASAVGTSAPSASPRKLPVLVKEVLANETDQLFKWQYAGGECPRGCVKSEGWCIDA